MIKILVLMVLMDDYVLTLFVLGQGQMNMTPKAFSFEDGSAVRRETTFMAVTEG